MATADLLRKAMDNAADGLLTAGEASNAAALAAAAIAIAAPMPSGQEDDGMLDDKENDGR